MTRLTRVLAFVAAISILPATEAMAAPMTYRPPVVQVFPNEEPPSVSAKSWILYDETTDAILGSLIPDERRAIASVTKIMTGLLALERADPREMVTISERAAATGEKEIDLVAGERISMDALFKSLMIHSANDAATAIAEHISGSVQAFVDLMNQRAAELGLSNTSFANPHGLDASNHYSSARELLQLARVAMATPGFSEVVRSKVVLIPPDPEGNFRRGTSTDLMLDWYEGAVGIKTGFTAQAQLTYVGAAERGGRMLYVVVLGSEGERGHFVDATKLLDYGFRQLGYYADVVLRADYTAMLLQRQPDPLVAMGDIETYVHLSSMGLTLENPRSVVSLPGPAPVPSVETTRSAERPPDSLLGALAYWISSVIGA